ncbi:hypothetical protein K7432_009821 [Basidiobolus ranarum]|uniref:Uncharacterized protein n=1 Tax=Basidiobolus ranarum TaxID=34480 RepID=A0ABR2VWG2_9FUNG
MPPSSPPFPLPVIDPRSANRDENVVFSMPQPRNNTNAVFSGIPQPPETYTSPTRMPEPLRPTASLTHMPELVVGQETPQRAAFSDPRREAFPNLALFPEPDKNISSSENSSEPRYNNFSRISNQYSRDCNNNLSFPEPEMVPGFSQVNLPNTMPAVQIPNISIPLTQPAGEMPSFPVPENYVVSDEYEGDSAEENNPHDVSNCSDHTELEGIVPVTDNLYPPLFSGYPPATPSQVAALTNLTGTNDSHEFEWVYSVDGYIPPEAVGCGKESNGSPLYVARRDYKKVTHVGITGPHLKGIRFVRKNSVLNQKACYVLCGDIKGLRWIKCMGTFKTNGEKLVQAGVTENEKPIYIGIVDYRGGIYIGEAGEHISGGMCFAYQNKKITAPDFYYILAYNY